MEFIDEIDDPVVVVNGFFPSFSIREFLSTINDLLEFTGPFGSLQEQVDRIKSYLSSSNTQSINQLYIVVHNIDGPMLRQLKTQDLLSLLAESPHIKLIATSDHLQAALLFDNVRISRYQFVWHDVTTFQPYIEETSYENSLLSVTRGLLTKKASAQL